MKFQLAPLTIFLDEYSPIIKSGVTRNKGDNKKSSVDEWYIEDYCTTIKMKDSFLLRDLMALCLFPIMKTLRQSSLVRQTSF